MGKKKKPSKRARRWRWKFYLLILALCLPGANWLYQAARKPTEVIGLFDSHFYKTPQETWWSYRHLFHENSTEIISPTLLAALAQTESQGNPIARTYWKWNWASPTQLFAPASTSAGLFQMTEGTYELAKDYCIQNNKLVRKGPWHSIKGCWFNWAYLRIWPAHAIEMTAAHLHHTVQALAVRYKKPISKKNKQKLATIAHLCGKQKAAQFLRHGFSTRRMNQCGSHSPTKYLRKVGLLDQTFAKLEKEAMTNP